MKPEDKFILEICKYVDVNRESVAELLTIDMDFSYVLGKLMINRLGALAFYNIQRLGLTQGLNREFLTPLKDVYYSCKKKNAAFQGLLCDFCGMLNRSEIKTEQLKYALLKGSALSQVYPEGTRTCNDIDVLTDRNGATVLSEILLGNGFVQGWVRNGILFEAKRSEIVSAVLNRGETIPFVKKTGIEECPIFEVDVNLSLDYKADRDSSRINEMLLSAQPSITTAAGPLMSLAKEDFIIHLCCHIYKEATIYNWVRFGRDQGLYKYIDVYSCLYNENDLFFERLIERIRRLGLSHECEYVFYVLKEMYLEPFTELFEIISGGKTNTFNIIYDPRSKKRYSFSQPIVEWVFNNKKRGHLCEYFDETE